jgi:hypothetical protein
MLFDVWQGGDVERQGASAKLTGELSVTNKSPFLPSARIHFQVWSMADN